MAIGAKFTAPADAASPRLGLQIQQHDLWTDVPGMEDADVCSADHLSPSCPMVKDKAYTLASTWTPGSDMPWAGDVKLRWRLDERGENAVTTLLCFTHDVDIHDCRSPLRHSGRLARESAGESQGCIRTTEFHSMGQPTSYLSCPGALFTQPTRR